MSQPADVFSGAINALIARDDRFGGIHFRRPWMFMPYHTAVANLSVADSSGVAQASSTTAFFTEMARRGAQDTTNWTADTYKTIVSLTGSGLMAAYVGCTAGGAETHTVEITVDGILHTMTVSGMASGERALLAAAISGTTAFSTTLNAGMIPGYTEGLDANKQIFGATVGSNTMIMGWWGTALMGVPLLRFDKSLLVRAKHSATITNSTATAYSAVMYRLGLTA